MDLWTPIDTQLDQVPAGPQRARLTWAILAWRTCDLVELAACLWLLVALVRHWGEVSVLVWLIAFFMARSVVRLLAWVWLPPRPSCG